MALRQTHKLGRKSDIAHACATIAMWTAVAGGLTAWQILGASNDHSHRLISSQFTTEQTQAQTIARAIDLDQRARSIADQKRRLDLLLSEDPAAPPILERAVILQMVSKAAAKGYFGFESMGGPLEPEQHISAPRPHWHPSANQLQNNSQPTEITPVNLAQQDSLDQDIETISKLFGQVTTTARQDNAEGNTVWQFDRKGDIANDLNRVEANQADALIWLHDQIGQAIAARRAILEKTGLASEAVFADASGVINRDAPLNENTKQVGGPLLEAATDAEPFDTSILDAEPAQRWNAGTALADNEQSLEDLAALNDILMALPIRFPTAEDRVWMSSQYGYRRDAFTKRRAFHAGMDFAGQRGVPVLATAEGIVTYAGRKGAYGNLVAISHGYGLKTRYAHLSRVDVKVGDLVAVGTPLGAIGSTGRSTGNHLHYEIWYGQNTKNPRPFVEAGRDLAALVNGETAAQAAK